MSLSYEEQRRQNIKENEDLLKSLGLTTPGRPARPALARTPSNASIKKRTKPSNPRAIATPAKVRRTDETPAPSSGLRRSTRSSARKSYAEDGEKPSGQAGDGSPGGGKRGRDMGDDVFVVNDEDDEPEERVKQRNNKSLGVRIHDPKQYGAIPDVEVGRWWATRQECSTDAIHAPFVAGISGNPIDGAYSVALSGGYADDVDLGTAFTYTGCGGRDLKGTKHNPKNLRTAAQTFNQSFDHPMNAALKRSAETRNPVRVIRGFKLPSVYAPAEGYRYDGLYIVERAWMGKGLTNGLLVCRYAFKRIPGQAELPVRVEEAIAEAE